MNSGHSNALTDLRDVILQEDEKALRRQGSINLSPRMLRGVKRFLAEKDDQTSEMILLDRMMEEILEQEVVPGADGKSVLKVSRATAIEVVGALALYENEEVDLTEVSVGVETLPEVAQKLMDTIEGMLPGELKADFNTMRFKAGVYMALDKHAHMAERTEAVTKAQGNKLQRVVVGALDKALKDKPLDGSPNNAEVYIKATIIPLMWVLYDTISGTLPGLEVVTSISVAFVLLAVLLKAQGFDRKAEGSMLSTLTKVAPRGISLIFFLWLANSFHIQSSELMLDPSMLETLAQAKDNPEMLKEMMESTDSVKVLLDVDPALTPEVAETGNQVLDSMGSFGDRVRSTLGAWRSFAMNKFPVSMTIGYGVYQLAKGMWAYLGASQMSEGERVDILHDNRDIPADMKKILGRLRMNRLTNQADNLIKMLGQPDLYTLDQSDNAISILRSMFNDPELQSLWAYDPSLKMKLTEICIAIVEGNGFDIDEQEEGSRRRKKHRDLV